MQRRNNGLAPSCQMRLDDLRHARRARFIVQVPQYRARIEDVPYHLSFRRRWRLSSAEKGGLAENIPRVLSTKSSVTGSRTMRDFILRDGDAGTGSDPQSCSHLRRNYKLPFCAY